MKLSAWHIFILAAVAVSCAKLSSSVPVEVPDSVLPPPPDEVAVNEIALNLPLVQPKIIIEKSKRRLSLYSGNNLVRTYRIGLGLSPIEDKIKEGDRKTPEGSFYIFTKNDKRAYYLSLALSYPNAEDATRGIRDGLINREQYDQIVNAVHSKTVPPQNTPLGGEIYIHGNGSQATWVRGFKLLTHKS